jgi:hypothetical protein
MRDGLTVGVTFYLHEGERSIFVNGGHQNAAFLVLLLEQCPSVKRVVCINGGPGDECPEGMMLDRLGFKFFRFEEVASELDVLIECGAQIPAEQATVVHQRGGIAIGYRFGNSFVLDAEKLISGRGNQAIFNGTKFDAIWSTPQHMYTNRSYWEGCYRAPVVELPHIWAPLFAEIARREMTDGSVFGYRPGKRPKSIAIYEPNIDVVKLAHIPMLLCDLVYREHPELIDVVWVTNTDRLRESAPEVKVEKVDANAGPEPSQRPFQKTFQHFHNTLDIGKKKAADGGKVCSCESRFNLIWFQAKHADICVSWQWENALNYAYYEVLAGGYPLVHNSHLLPDGIGYRYEGFDAHDGARALLRALQTHDERHEAYCLAVRSYLRTVHPLWQPNIDRHEAALQSAFAQAA